MLLNVNSNTTVKCMTHGHYVRYGFPGGIVAVYSVSYDGFKACNVTGGKLLGSINCSSNNQILDFPNKEGETYYLIGE